MMIGKKIVVSLMIVAMMVIAVIGAEQGNELLSTLNIYSPTGELGAIDTNDKTSVQTLTLIANSTQSPTLLFNGQYLNVYSLAGYGWHYYYIDVAPYATVSISHYTSSSTNNLEIFMENYALPTAYSYSKKGYLRTYSNTLTSDSKTYSNRVYIAVRNTLSYSSTSYTLNVRVNAGSAPTPTPLPAQVYYRTDYSLTFGLGIPAIVLSFILLIVVISQVRKIAALTKRVIELEKKMNGSMQSCEEMMPVMMNVPLMSANSLQQDHEEVQSVVVQQQPIVQPPTSQVPQQQPTTIPQLFPQFVQQQALPPQFRNAQPYPFAYPQVVFAQPPHIAQQQVQQPQQQPQQQQMGQTQSKQ